MVAIVFNYVIWHFSTAIKDLGKLMTNYIVAVWQRFLITQHFKTLFAPWHRRQPSDVHNKVSIQPDNSFLNFVADLYIRILAAFARATVIFVGLIVELVVIYVFFVIIVVWVTWPLLVIRLVSKGITLIL